MIRSFRIVSFAVCALSAMPVFAAEGSAPNPCPVSYSKLSMPYKHPGGASVPMVELSFTNETKKKIERAKFGLIVLNQTGGQDAYDKLLTFSAGADAGKAVDAEWALDMEKITMYRYGETIYLQSVRFADDTTWQDDGNQRCRQDIYYGPK